MKAKVRLFARLSDLAGLRETEVELGEGLTVSELFAALAHTYPALAGYASSLMYAVNAEYVPSDHPVQDGDEVAFIPPVSGGARCGSR
ncbi:MAG: molybdopterin converting factor subunit 1 [Chloroflexi bacterium]|nr:molybdopterin converting factor subunit 1 [Chloroflexota bacterium]